MKLETRSTILSSVAAILLTVGMAVRASSAEDAIGSKTVRINTATYHVLTAAEDHQYDFSFELARKAPSAAVELVAGYQDPDNYYRMVLSGKSSLMFRKLAGKEVELPAGVGGVEAVNSLRVIVRRRSSMFYVCVNGRSSIEIMDATFSSGVIALRDGSGAVSNDRYQPVEDIQFADDFMRTDQEQQMGVWQTVRGSWRFHSVRETNPSADYRRSVNPFSLGGRAASGTVTTSGGAAPEIALVTAGYPFWIDYDYRLSVKSVGGVAGLVFNYQNEHNFYVVRWDMTQPFRRPSRMEVVKVRPGESTVLAAGYADCAPDQWYRLGVRTTGRRMQVYLDGDLMFDAVDRDATGGKVGLYVEGMKEAFFDDITVETNPDYVFDRNDTWIRNSAFRSGQWKFELNATSDIAGASGPHFLIVDSNEASHYWLGNAGWQDQVMDLQFKNPSGKGWVGIGFGAKNPQNFNMVRWTSESSTTEQRLQLVRVASGKETVVASAPVGFDPKARHVLQVDFSEPNHIKAYADGVLKIRENAAGMEGGALGVYASGARGAAIDNLTVSFEKMQGKEKIVNNEIFKTDPFMLLWSSEKGDWFPVKDVTNAYWHKGDFHGPFSVTLPPAAGTQVNVSAATHDFSSGYALQIAAESDGTPKAVLKRQAETVAQGIAPAASGNSLTLHREDEFLWVTLGDREILTYHDTQPVRGTLVGLMLPTAVELDKVKLERYHVIDHLFETAPTDWTRIGTWEITNRFSCTPTWSHMTARTDQVAVLWNKFELEGDCTIEYYAGMRMQSARPLSYPRTGDINLTFCADGKDLSSGYSYLVGAWDPGWTSKYTQLLRKTEMVAQTDRYLIPRVREGQGGRQIEVPLIADGRPIHGAWYYIKVRKIGDKIECYFDNELVLTYEDKNPLKGKYFALWTQDNEIVVARMKVSYENFRTPQRLRKAPPELRVPADSGGAYINISSPSHPGLDFDFENSFQGWKTTDPEQGAFLELDDSNRSTGKRCLRLTNVNTGGDFGAKVPVPYGFDLLKVADLSFNYKINHEARVNLYLKIRGRNHFIEFTGDPSESELLPRIGKIEGVVQDNQWHHASFSLGSALRSLYPKDTTLMLDELTLGNLHEGYLRAAFGGNYGGTTYCLDDFQMVAADPRPPVLQWFVRGTGAAPVNVNEYVYKLDHRADTDPMSGEATSETRKEFSNLEPGTWYLHVRGKSGDGRFTNPAHFAFFLNSRPFSIASVDPPAGAQWGGTPITIKLQSDDRVYPLATGTTLTVNGSPVSDMDRWTRFDLAKYAVVVDLSHSPLSFTNGQKVDLDLHLVKNGGQAQDYKWSYIVDTSKDENPPLPVRLTDYPEYAFDEGTGTFRSADVSAAMVVNDPTDGSSRKGSVKIVNARLGSNMGVVAWDRPFAAGSYPLLSFDYRIPQEVHSDIILGTQWQPTHIVFADTDTSGSYETLGSIEGVVRDDQWHHAEVNLYKTLSRQPFHRSMYNLSALSFGDYGYAGVAPGSGYHIDNFQLVPVINGKRGVTLAWQSADFSGIKGYSAKWSANPSDDAEPTVNVPGGSQTYTINEEGVRYLHLRAQDAAGNWSEPAHYRFIVDNSPPQIGPIVPGNGEKFGTSKLVIPIRDGDYSGIDPSSLSVSVNGKEFLLDEVVTDLDEQNGRITWDWALLSNFSEQPVPDGTEVQFAVKPIKDYADSQTSPMQWSANIDYASDKEPPIAPEVRSTSHSLLSLDSFTRSLGEWGDWGGRPSYDLSRYLDPAKKDYVLRLNAGGGRRGSAAYIRKTPYSAATYPFVSFEYKFGSESRIQLLCLVGGQWRAVQLTGPSRRYPVVSVVPNIHQDGAWHVAFINLFDLLRRSFPGVPNLVIESLSLGEEGTSGDYFIDNFAIFGPGKSAPQLKWTDFDPTGIQGFSYQIDQNSGAMPDTTSEGNDREKTLPALVPGMWYFHIRAQDGAGNWGAPMHYPYFVGG